MFLNELLCHKSIFCLPPLTYNLKTDTKSSLNGILGCPTPQNFKDFLQSTNNSLTNFKFLQCIYSKLFLSVKSIVCRFFLYHFWDTLVNFAQHSLNCVALYLFKILCVQYSTISMDLILLL